MKNQITYTEHNGLYYPNACQNLNLWSLPYMSNGHKFIFCHMLSVILTGFCIAKWTQKAFMRLIA